MIVVKKVDNFYWRNRFSEHPVVLVDITTAGADSWNFESLYGTVRNLIARRFPALNNSKKKITASHFLAAICMTMQREKFSVPFAIGAKPNQFYFAASDYYYAAVVVGRAVSFLNKLISHPNSTDDEVAKLLSNLEDASEQMALDQSIRAIIAEAEKRNIPWFRISANARDVQFGHGRQQQRMRETLTSLESALAMSYARDKGTSCNLLYAVGLPVGKYSTAMSPAEAVAQAKDIGFPVVLKPVSGGKGENVIIGLNNAEAVRKAATVLLEKMPQIIIQSFFPGDDHRLLVVNGKFIAAARREAAAVIGDGKSTIGRLIEIANMDPRRGKKFYRLMNYITIDDELQNILKQQGYDIATVLAEGVKAQLRRTANISTGGTAVDVTDIIHRDNIILAQRAAKTIGLKVAGIDFITPDISKSWKDVGGGICEINASVGLRPHWLGNPERNVVAPILDTIFPAGKNGRVPTAMITGSNGKTTTSRMLDHILRSMGQVVGCVTTDGVTINGNSIIDKDVAGVYGASMVLNDPNISAAVLETARGGLAKRGIYLETCNVAAVLNVGEDHIGIDGVNSVEQMAKLKRKVAETAQQKVVFNAEDPHCLKMAQDFMVEHTILFSLDVTSPAIKAHVAAGGEVVTIGNIKGRESIVLAKRGDITNIVAVEEIPATFGGIVRHNIANAMAAVALAHGMGVPVKNIAEGLRFFTPTMKDSAGRFTIINDFPAPVLFDFGHNPPAIETVMKSVEKFKKSGHNICALTTPGNRLEKHFEGCAKAVAGKFDYYICFERVEWRRGKKVGYIARRLENGLIKAGVEADKIISCLSQNDAMESIASLVRPDDFVAVFGTDARVALPQMRKACEKVAA